MGIQSIITGFECFRGHHTPGVSSVATWAVKGECCSAVVYTCRTHMPIAVNRATQYEINLGHGYVTKVRPLEQTREQYDRKD